MAVWQTGVVWAPPEELLTNDLNGARKHVAKHFASWTCRLARAATRHKAYPETKEVCKRTDNTCGRHGLAPQEVKDRADRAKAAMQLLVAVCAMRAKTCCAEKEVARSDKGIFHKGAVQLRSNA